jgi:galactokinase
VKSFKSRCAGRISLSKHADYINSHLLYLLDDRETVIDSKLDSGSGKIILINEDFGDREFSINEIDSALENKLDWSFYVLKLIRVLKLENFLQDKNLSLKIESKIPAAGGLSSSHALLLSVFINLAELFEIKEYQEVFKDPHKNKAQSLRLIKLCQSIEEARGFKSGLGDQCAQLFSKKGYLTSIKIFPDLEVNYIEIPKDLSFVTIPSYVVADKSTPEFITKNQNIEKYKTLNKLVNKFNCDYLADLLDRLTESEIFDFLESIDDSVLRGLALYGLAEASRVKSLSKDFTLTKLGNHLNLSHQAEVNYRFNNKGIPVEIKEADKLSYLFDRKTALEKHCGYYHASTKENDTLAYLTKKFAGVYGTSITGAGFGGNNIAAIKSSRAQELRGYLIAKYYINLDENYNLDLLHIISSNNGVSII